MKKNYNECFNETCIVFCIYVVMLFMISMDLEFLETMTIVFIVICSISVLEFALQAIYGVIKTCFDNCEKKQKMKNLES